MNEHGEELWLSQKEVSTTIKIENVERIHLWFKIVKRERSMEEVIFSVFPKKMFSSIHLSKEIVFDVMSNC